MFGLLAEEGAGENLSLRQQRQQLQTLLKVITGRDLQIDNLASALVRLSQLALCFPPAVVLVIGNLLLEFDLSPQRRDLCEEG